MLKLDAVTVGYGKPRAGREVLHSLSCAIPRGKITVLAGPNGSGKSTLLKTMCGFLPAWSGGVSLAGEPLSAYSSASRARQVAYVAQQHGRLSASAVTVRRLALYGRFPYTRFPRHYTEQDHAVAAEALEQLGMTALADVPLAELSGGQQQKAYLAMALSQATPLLLLDEPLTFLDIRQQLELLAALRRLCSQGKTICLVVHDLNTALTFADALIVLDGGRVVAQGAPAAIAADGVIDRVFGVRTECVVLPRGGILYSFTTALVEEN